jgi:hypothetical protein
MTGLLNSLNPISEAQWNASNDPSLLCTPGTRVTLLNELHSWATGGHATPPILWLTGMAGTGKSAIARSFCAGLPGECLLGTFFISRQILQCRSSLNIVRTLAWQLGMKDARIRNNLCTCMAQESSLELLTRGVEDQFEHLIGIPLKTVNNTLPLTVIVVDAIDEAEKDANGCEAGQFLVPLINLLTDSPPLPNVKFLLTSRTEPGIQRVMSGINSKLVLRMETHDIDPRVVSQDIRTFLDVSFSNMTHLFKSIDLSGWPSPSRIETIVQRSSNLFIYAATITRYVSDVSYDPRIRLDEALAVVSPKENILGALDGLYTNILDKATFGQNTIRKRMKVLLGTVLFLQDSVTVTIICSLVGLCEYEVQHDIRTLSSVLVQDSRGVITAFHPSFIDFLTERSDRVSGYGIDSHDAHLLLAQSSLILLNTRLKSLVRDCSHIGTLNNDLPITKQADFSISTELEYACRFWVHHLVESHASNECHDMLLEALSQFCKVHVLEWLEILSIQGCLHVAAEFLPMGIQCLRVSTSPAQLISKPVERLTESHRIIGIATVALWSLLRFWMMFYTQ